VTRILADLLDEGIKWLDQLVAEQGKSRAAILSRIIRWHRQHIESNR
jgi:hypothetical protein